MWHIMRESNVTSLCNLLSTCSSASSSSNPKAVGSCCSPPAPSPDAWAFSSFSLASSANASSTTPSARSS
eukprot:2712124-Pyramimonas_sp.AAC.1